MRRPFRKYLRFFALTAAILLLSLGAFNLVIDPYRSYRLIKIARLDEMKFTGSGRITKAEMLRHGPWDTVILGSSRVEVGIDPAHPAWGAQRVYNAGLPGIYFPEVAGVFEYVCREVRPRRIILCVDFFQFNDRARQSQEFAQSRFNSSRPLIEYHAEALFGYESAKRSWKSLTAAMGDGRPEYSSLGLRIKPVNRPGQTARDAFEKFLARTADIRRQDMPWGSGHECLKLLRQMLEACRKGNIELIVVITPVHALEMELLHALGAQDSIDRWKQSLAQEINRDAEAHNGPAFPLWDFTGYRGHNAEPVPPAGDSRPMRWYWEPSHFKKELGDLVISRITGNHAVADTTDRDFGVQLTPQNINAHLAQVRIDRAAFVKQFQAEVEAVQRCAAE